MRDRRAGRCHGYAGSGTDCGGARRLYRPQRRCGRRVRSGCAGAVDRRSQCRRGACGRIQSCRTVWPDANVARTWYATTDADSRVDPDWLVRQMVADVDMVLGVVRVAYWRHVPSSVAGRYLHRYRSKSASDGAGHNHVHGANMGFVAEKYWEVGCFAALPSSEDVDLVRRFEQRSYHIRRDANLSVVTSARHDGRAPNGFAAPAVHAAPTWCRGSGVTTPLVRQWLDAGELNLPLPVSGDTFGRWSKLAEFTEVDVVAGRLAEAHTDAVAMCGPLRHLDTG